MDISFVLWPTRVTSYLAVPLITYKGVYFPWQVESLILFFPGTICLLCTLEWNICVLTALNWLSRWLYIVCGFLCSTLGYVRFWEKIFSSLSLHKYVCSCWLFISWSLLILSGVPRIIVLIMFPSSFLCRQSQYAPQIHLYIMNLELLLIIWRSKGLYSCEFATFMI